VRQKGLENSGVVGKETCVQPKIWLHNAKYNSRGQLYVFFSLLFLANLRHLSISSANLSLPACLAA